MMVTLGQQYNVGENKPTVILDTYLVVTESYQGQRVQYVIPVAYSSPNVCMCGQHFKQSMIWINRVLLPGHHLKK